MATGASSPTPPRARPSQDRRRPRADGARGRRWATVKALLVRPFGLQRVDGHWRLAFVERRVAVADEQALVMAALDEALHGWLLAQPHQPAAHVMRHLLAVHEALVRAGWPAVEALPSAVLRKAVVQLEMLVAGGWASSARLPGLADRLRAVEVASGLREEAAARAAPPPVADSVLISEVPHEEFEAAERGWADRPGAGEGAGRGTGAG